LSPPSAAACWAGRCSCRSSAKGPISRPCRQAYRPTSASEHVRRDHVCCF
jgi:hypothetical protein